ncbi:MAG: DUF4286 family protein, partial [Gammaproteobacteria bacterium]|nr:DUF4286 family protein [Gammaproteobacteria bacterium]
MREHLGPIYEVTLCVDGASASGLDDWLGAHAAKMLEIPGFEGADISKLDDADGRHCRIVRYYVADDDALAEYLVNQAIDMRVATVERFGENFEATARTLHESIRPVVSEPRHCLNCDAVLSGQYCGTCGQRADSRLISVWELFKDAFADLLDVDSRLWRTLHQLALRPGQLTRDYLRGRRARYIPPFRSYLVLSLFFFLVAFFNPRDQFSLFFEPGAEETEQVAERDAKREEVLAELEAEGVIVRPN